jgi:hypothetical protein
MTAKEWLYRAINTYNDAVKIDATAPGSLVAVELFARAATEAAIATAMRSGARGS